MNSQPIEFCFRYCPVCGTKNGDLGSVPFRCTQCDYANFFGPVAAVGGLLVNGENQILLVRRARDPGKGKWGLPGGFVDRGETIEEALVREVVEETGLTVISSAYLISFPNQYDYRGIVAPIVDMFYTCQVESSKKIVLAKDELDYFEWVRPSSEHLNQMAFPSNRRAIEHWMAASR